ncbi:hypothetical protein [uncultured Rikenella sp.]|uniref:hypothetical protein n=1 Tax=uncultured Rikenella sp. TaxID=368003 RepID=UPI002627B4F2|nr:hypothetical protein [uncultured Rikenella sp.]
MNNPLQILKAIKNPKQFAMNMIKKSGNPIFNNLTDMAEKGDTQGLQNFARNIFKEHGADFDKEFQEFMSTFKN